MVEPVRQLPLDLQFAPAMGRADFMVGECNCAAVHLVEGWPDDWRPYPALILFGQKGCGKSHLAAVWQHRSDAATLSPRDFIQSDPEKLIADRKHLVIDGLEFLVGEREQEEKLFHLYNAFLQDGLSFMALSAVSPERLEFVILDLASRLRASPRAEIKLPDEDLLAKVLAKRFYDQNLKIDQGGLDYLLPRMERSWDGLDRLVETVRLYATATRKGELTKPLLRAAMMEMESAIRP